MHSQTQQERQERGGDEHGKNHMSNNMSNINSSFNGGSLDNSKPKIKKLSKKSRERSVNSKSSMGGGYTLSELERKDRSRTSKVGASNTNVNVSRDESAK